MNGGNWFASVVAVVSVATDKGIVVVGDTELNITSLIKIHLLRLLNVNVSFTHLVTNLELEVNDILINLAFVFT